MKNCQVMMLVVRGFIVWTTVTKVAGIHQVAILMIYAEGYILTAKCVQVAVCLVGGVICNILQ
jgi:hypothetical protein